MARAVSRPAKTPRTSASAPTPQPTAARWRPSETFLYAIAGAALLWAALPPLDLGPLAFLAPVPWVLLARGASLPGRWPLVNLWLAAFLFWLAAIYWLTLPHWATAFGWLALSAYLACFLPAFVLLTRWGVHRAGLSAILAAPIAWTGLELVRAHILGGFLMAALGHTQHAWIGILQISDITGAYGVSFLVVLVAACIARMLPFENSPRAWWPLAPAAIALALALGYGELRTAQRELRPGPKVALIQGSIDSELKSDPTRATKVYEEYLGLSIRAVRAVRDLDLLVWPETMFRIPWYTFAADYQPKPEVTWTPDELTSLSKSELRNTAMALETPLLLGIEAWHHAGPDLQRYNSALLTDREGTMLAKYDKMHLVMFGEYVPLASTFPWLYKLTPLATSLATGGGPVSLEVGRFRYAANICYESTNPHLIRTQVHELTKAGHEPDVLVNLTNDGWFWGSTELDMHLTCGVFRAIECRKPFLIAANTGISASIDSDGRIVGEPGPRRANAVLIAAPQLDSRRSWYAAHGDWFAGGCLAGCLTIAGIAWSARRRERNEPRSV